MARGNKFILSEVSFGPEILKLLSEAVHVNAMIAVVEAEAVAAAPKLRDWLISLGLSPAAPLIVWWASFLLFLEK